MSIKFKKHGFQNPPFRTIISQMRDYKTFENYQYINPNNHKGILWFIPVSILSIARKEFSIS